MDGWAALGQRVTAERGRRWKSREAFSRASGVSTRVLDDLERGRRSNYAESTLAAVEAALGWEPGSCLRIVQGGRPRREADPLLVRLLDAWRVLSPDARRMLVDVAERTVEGRQ
jgi:transcriptional regulator with XRE-family HTH domain